MRGMDVVRATASIRQRVAAHTPAAVKRQYHRAATYRLYRRIASDWRSVRALAALESKLRPAEILPVRLRAQSDETVYARTGTSDLWVLLDSVVERYQMPPRELVPRSAKLIWDLGANIGVTTASFAAAFPDACVVGVELDAANAALAERNVTSWRTRCRIIHGAVWPTDGRVAYSRAAREHSYAVDDDPCPSGPPNTRAEAKAISLDSLLLETGNGTEVDFAKMDIEAAEMRVLQENTAWATRVRCIKVEVHDPWAIDGCVEALRALDYTTLVDTAHWACVIGYREPVALSQEASAR